MKKLVSLSNKEILTYVLSSSELRDRFDKYIYEGEMDYLSDKTSCFKGRAANWQLGTCCHNYFEVKDCDEFVAGVAESIRCFGGTEKLTKLTKQCERLWGSNLYEHMVDKLCEMYYEQELKPIINWIEQVSMYIYNEEPHEDLFDYVDYFAECCLDDIWINDKGEMIRRNLVV